MQELFLIPQPRKVVPGSGALPFSGACVTSDDAGIGAFLRDVPPGSTPVQFGKDAALHPEGYTLEVTDRQIRIRYGTLEGAFRAVSTLRQLIALADNGSIPCLHIEDWPAIARRGYLLDLSRGKIPTLTVLKQFADILSALKYNEWHLYLNRFGFQFQNFARYWKDTNALSPQEVRELDAYCRERFIKLVPNLNSFGHMEAFTEKEEFRHLALSQQNGQPSHILNPLLEESLELVDSVFDGLFDHFTSDTVHIGMDETYLADLRETGEVCAQYGAGRVYTEFLNKVLALVENKYHRRPMFWADIVFHHPQELKNIPASSVVMDWGYESEYNFEGHCALLEKLGLRYYVCPGTSMWGSFTGRSNNAAFNILSAAVSARDHGAEGFLLTEWGDDGYPQFYSTTYFPLVFGGAVAWNPGEHFAYVRAKLIDSCQKYLDKYIYRVTGTVSLADIVYRMGNYYLLESRLRDNMTCCGYYSLYRKPVTPADAAGFRRVIAYMEETLEELKGVRGGREHIPYIEANARLVILLCRLYTGAAVEEAELAEAKRQFISLWNAQNKPYLSGPNSFTQRLDRIFQTYRTAPREKA